MKAVDPTIKLMGPELSQWGTDISKTPKFPAIETPTGLEQTGLDDGFPQGERRPGGCRDCAPLSRLMLPPVRRQSLRIRCARIRWNGSPMVTYLRDLIHQITGRDIPIAFTEVNSDPGRFMVKVWLPRILFTMPSGTRMYSAG